MKKKEFFAMFELEDSHFWFIGKRFCIDTVLNRRRGRKILQILDIGCGTGGTTRFLKKYGNVQGLEYNEYAYRLAKKRMSQVTKGTAQKLPFKDTSFDMVTLFDVLYHRNIIDVKKALQEAKRVLVPNGRILITDSAFPQLWSTHDKAMHAKRRFTISELEKLLTNEGFVILKSSYFFFFLFPFIFIKRRIIDVIFGKHQSDVQRLNPLLNFMGVLLMKGESWLLRYFSLPYGSSLIIYAEKTS